MWRIHTSALMVGTFAFSFFMFWAFIFRLAPCPKIIRQSPVDQVECNPRCFSFSLLLEQFTIMAKLYLWLVLIPMILAHSEGGNGFPKFVGGGHLASKLRSRGAFPAVKVPEHADVLETTDPRLHKRQNCGLGVGSCPTGFCCSSGG